MHDLVSVIHEKQRRLAQLETEAEQLRQELAKAREALSGPAPPRIASAVPFKAGAGKSTTALAAMMLRTTGRPMHLNHLIEAIAANYGVTIQAATLVSNISRLVKKGKTFERVGPNTFGLRDWAVERDVDEMFGRAEFEREMGVDAH